MVIKARKSTGARTPKKDDGMCYFDPGRTMLSADDVTLYANDSFASHPETARAIPRARMELEGGSLPESQRLRVGVLRDH